jgi:hypothetical protein
MLEDLQPAYIERKCKLRTVASTLEPKDAKLLYEFVADEENWSALGLSKALSTKGIMISDQIIKRHRTFRCSCAQNARELKSGE